MFSPKLTKIRIPAFTNFSSTLCHRFCPIQWKEKEIKDIQIAKEGVKLSLLIGDMTVYVNNLIECTKKIDLQKQATSSQVVVFRFYFQKCYI